MIQRNIIKTEQAMYAIKNGEFDTKMITSKSKVIVILTQDWCPQWIDMKNWVYTLKLEEDIEIYEFEYNKTEYFNEFMSFKESYWNNYYVPYLRFYKEGILAKETNYIDKSKFMDIVKNL
ncbi:hypothetical protein EHE19_018830 [Ruminiclostridium herbifermentans]|uniref:Thioredoxin family protein n=1 Tax=Ruminiclostridium herbifermentans TaxID=2488810 RepID=A0A4U7JB43_9FIRM|nr:hypothetical protein [Ruminiclostridium herbifermentans]QNU66855.1 hypothetical protein EHE19_018830 [Ruminiclostridium herbifermentans]